MTLFDHLGPLGRQRPQFDCFAHNVTTTVSMSWEGFFLSWEGRFIAGGGNDFYVGGTAPSRVLSVYYVYHFVKTIGGFFAKVWRKFC